jgi:hypothetical protein
MQKLYLNDLGNASTNVASDAATTAPNVAIATAKEIPSKSLNFEKGETAVETEEKRNTVPNTPSDDGVDEDQLNLKVAEDSLKSLAHSVPSANAVPDAPSPLAEDQPQADVQDDVGQLIADDVIEKDTTVVANSPVPQEKDVNTDNTMSVDDDVTIVKTVGDPKKRSGKTGVGS